VSQNPALEIVTPFIGNSSIQCTVTGYPQLKLLVGNDPTNGFELDFFSTVGGRTLDGTHDFSSASSYSYFMAVDDSNTGTGVGGQGLFVQYANGPTTHSLSMLPGSGSTEATVVWDTDTGLSRTSAGTLALGNGTSGDTTGNLQLGKITSYDGTATVKAGAPSIVASTALTSQSAALTDVTLYAVPAGKAGLYRITYNAEITTAASVSSSLGGSTGFQSVYTSISDGVVKTSNPTTPAISAANTTGTAISSVVYAYAEASTNIQYSFGYTSSGTPMVFALQAYVEYLG